MELREKYHNNQGKRCGHLTIALFFVREAAAVSQGWITIEACKDLVGSTLLSGTVASHKNLFKDVAEWTRLGHWSCPSIRKEGVYVIY